MFYRSLTSTIVLGIMLNRNYKALVIDSVQRNQLWSISLRVLQNTSGIFVNLYALQFYGLTVVTMCLNLAPMITCIVAYPLLGEKVSAQSFITLIAAFAAAYLMIMGGD